MPGRWPFPAARSIPSDASPVAAALREAKEETGLAPGLIEPIGYLDLYLTFPASASCRRWRGSSRNSR